MTDKNKTNRPRTRRRRILSRRNFMAYSSLLAAAGVANPYARAQEAAGPFI